MNYKLIRYTHGPGIDEPLIMERDGKSYYYHFDGLGSVSEITDEQGNIGVIDFFYGKMVVPLFLFY